MIFHLPLAHDLNLVGTLTAAQYPYSIHVGGLDIVSKVPEDSIRVVETGPGGVSSMSFTIWDTDSSLTIQEGSEVRMWDYVRDLPMFLGWVEHVNITPWAAEGRTLDVGAFGIEALLDTVIIPAFTFSFGQTAIDDGNTFNEVQTLQLLGGFAPLRTFAAVATSNQAGPVGYIQQAAVVGADVVVDGMTIRQAYEAWTAGAWFPWPDALAMVKVTVDFWGGLRAWGVGGQFGSNAQPTDYAAITVTDTSAGAVAATNLTYSVDTSPGAIVNAVYVKGAAAASTGWVVGDTRTGRREDYTTVTGVLASDKFAAASAILAQRGGPAGRGSLTLENFTPINAHPGSRLIITDARFGWSSKVMNVTQIEKSIVPGSLNQDWTVSFADPVLSPATAGPPSAMRFVRSEPHGPR